MMYNAYMPAGAARKKVQQRKAKSFIRGNVLTHIYDVQRVYASGRCPPGARPGGRDEIF